MEMETTHRGDSYKTDPSKIKKMKFFRKNSFFFYTEFMWMFIRYKFLFKKNQDSWTVIFNGSKNVVDMTEKRGGVFDVSGMDNINNLSGPAVFVANHMSMMETLVLFHFVGRPLAFVLKDTLQKIPLFDNMVSNSQPIAVTRKNPGRDLLTVMREGKNRLDNGISVMLFPHGSRTLFFDQSTFNSLGIKLALHAGYPVIPVALKTDFLGRGRLISYFGKIDPNKTIRIDFGPVLKPEGRGKEQHQQTVDFISEKLESWGVEVKRGKKG